MHMRLGGQAERGKDGRCDAHLQLAAHALHNFLVTLIKLLLAHNLGPVVVVRPVGQLVLVPVGVAAALDAAAEKVIEGSTSTCSLFGRSVLSEYAAAHHQYDQRHAEYDPKNYHGPNLLLLGRLWWRSVAAWRRGCEGWRRVVLASRPVVASA